MLPSSVCARPSTSSAEEPAADRRVTLPLPATRKFTLNGDGGISWAARARALAQSTDFGHSFRYQHAATDGGTEEPGSPSSQSNLSATNSRITTSRTRGADSDISSFSVGDNSGSLHKAQKVYKHNGEELSWSEVLYLWQHDDEFCDLFTDTLCESEYDDFFWETLPVSAHTAAEHSFQFIVIDAKGVLASHPGNPRLFHQHTMHIQGSDQVVTFHNQSQRADMVAPCQSGPESHYGHLAAFLRSAPIAQIREFWRVLGQRVENLLGEGGRSPKSPVWVSSHGIGVPWVHIRLDSSPRFYHYTPWKVHPSKIVSLGHSWDPTVRQTTSLRRRPLAGQSSGNGPATGVVIGRESNAILSSAEVQLEERVSLDRTSWPNTLNASTNSVSTSVPDDLYAGSEPDPTAQLMRGCFCMAFRPLVLMFRCRAPSSSRVPKQRRKHRRSGNPVASSLTSSPGGASDRRNVLYAMTH